MKTVKTILLVLVALMLLGGNGVSALSPEQKRLFQGGILYFDVESALSSPTNGQGTCMGLALMTINNPAALAQTINEYLNEKAPSDSPLKGLGDAIVAGGTKAKINPLVALGHAQMESSYGTTGIATIGTHNAFGRKAVESQPHISDGKNIWYKWNSWEQSFNSDSTWFDYMNEMWIEGQGYAGDTLDYIPGADGKLAYAPESDGNNTNTYQEVMKQVMQELIDKAGNSISCGVAGSVSADGYSFPVAPQRKSENGGVPGMTALPCTSNACHHDNTPAFDISRQPGGDEIVGTPVFAISDGTIAGISDSYMGQVGCNTIQLLSSKDNVYYAYLHIQNPVVQEGDTVKAGQQIASIGERRCTGNGSDSHLHIDRGCMKDGQPQRGGAPSCRDEAMVGIINALWEQLPE